MQLPLSSPAVTARYYWGDVAAGNAQTVFKKDNGDSAKYLVPEGRGSPLENLNKAGTLAGARAYDAFGVTNYSSGTALTPFEYYANLRLSGTQIAMTAQGRPYFAEIGQNVDGGYRLTYFNGQGSACGGECGPVFELHPALPKKRGGGTLPLPYPPERPGILPGQCRPGNVTAPIRTTSLEMPSIGSLDFPCTWLPGPGDGDGGCGCDPNNTAFFNTAAPGVTGYKSGYSQADPCKCTLIRKSGSAPNLGGAPLNPDPHADQCCYRVKCNGGGEMDISNLDAQELYQYQQACCSGGKKKKECEDEPCTPEDIAKAQSCLDCLRRMTALLKWCLFSCAVICGALIIAWIVTVLTTGGVTLLAKVAVAATCLACLGGCASGGAFMGCGEKCRGARLDCLHHSGSSSGPPPPGIIGV